MALGWVRRPRGGWRTAVRRLQGLTEDEFSRIEATYGLEFSSEYRAFLAAGLPVASPPKEGATWQQPWPDWRDADEDDLRYARTASYPRVSTVRDTRSCPCEERTSSTTAMTWSTTSPASSARSMRTRPGFRRRPCPSGRTSLADYARPRLVPLVDPHRRDLGAKLPAWTEEHNASHRLVRARVDAESAPSSAPPTPSSSPHLVRERQPDSTSYVTRGFRGQQPGRPLSDLYLMLADRARRTWRAGQT